MKNSDSHYIALARKYRPLNFTDLIGQEAMVRTFTNAFKSNRLHHAYIFSGVRGVGKTTTARILARAFNYQDENGAKPNIALEKEGEHCRAIIEGRHVDVIEMDAASNTGIDNIREIIDSVKYGPVSAPFKIYIIDEVHMLSNAAFNGLLKTLEEPPSHVKFIFATTEIHKVPITILSRCQRFDLRRIDHDTMLDYLKKILAKEKINAEQGALDMIVRAGEGSVRDCLSLLDQAIAYADSEIKINNIEEMLGLADRVKIIDLFELLMGGKIEEALNLLRELYNLGSDAKLIIVDLANLTHLCTRIKIVPTTKNDIYLTPYEAKHLPIWAEKLSMRSLTRAWQILSASIEEVTKAGDQIQALEMVLIRLCYAADLPTPDEIIKKIEGQTQIRQTENNIVTDRTNRTDIIGQAQLNIKANLSHEPETSGAQIRAVAKNIEEEEILPENYSQLVALADKKRDLSIKYALENYLRPINFEIGKIEVALTKEADPLIIAQLSERLKKWTKRSWLITVSNDETNVPTISEQFATDKKKEIELAKNDEMVKAILQIFPKAKLADVRIKKGKDNSANNIIDGKFSDK